MNPDLSRLQPYPFERMARLLAGVTPPAGLETIRLSIGEPKHPTPTFIAEAMIEHLHGLSLYPSTRGTDTLRTAICNWLTSRFGLPANSLDPERHALPVNGTREALFAIAQCMIDRSRNAAVLMPNPFYQIYEGAALLAGAAPVFVNATADSHYLPDFAAIGDSTWKRCQLLYLCSPGNPTGRIIDNAAMQSLIALADKHDFVIVSDECYSEIYLDEDTPPPGLLQAAAQMGNDSYKNCLVFHSLSKRSNAPGLRSGFVAGDADLIQAFFRYRTYHGCAMPPATQDASIRAWLDEAHVVENRRLYREKFLAVADILSPAMEIDIPPAGFYLWQRTPLDDCEFSRELYRQQNVVVLPGSYLSRDTRDGNPGHNHVRMALVAPLDECVDAAQRIRTFTEQL
ncbi:succinyldiaminopimelate aminotransferase [Thiogranum longum]|uniref:Succinyldiaminopimelate aminotransferase n=1 Tax=Thiogranum longum TaxID=1537524 RepID=A0A4R1HMI9_9GAMM|nr:succinyldiaminopimelate transaminase [Thiogranum longum]TCK18462.1 succinyldiaminopimelate aminotransferase [Thiogranum longum]